MSQNEEKLNQEVLTDVSGGVYRQADYDGLYEETDNAYICGICGMVFKKDVCYFGDLMYHLKTAHGIDRSIPLPIPKIPGVNCR